MRACVMRVQLALKTPRKPSVAPNTKHATATRWNCRCAPAMLATPKMAQNKTDVRKRKLRSPIHTAAERYNVRTKTLVKRKARSEAATKLIQSTPSTVPTQDFEG